MRARERLRRGQREGTDFWATIWANSGCELPAHIDRVMISMS